MGAAMQHVVCGGCAYALCKIDILRKEEVRAGQRLDPCR